MFWEIVMYFLIAYDIIYTFSIFCVKQGWNCERPYMQWVRSFYMRFKGRFLRFFSKNLIFMFFTRNESFVYLEYVYKRIFRCEIFLTNWSVSNALISCTGRSGISSPRGQRRLSVHWNELELVLLHTCEK